MKVFIVVDMEGATGVVHRDQLMPEGNGYAASQKLLTADVNAAIEGVLREASDATFVVGDGHGIMRNVILSDLHDRAELVVGPAAPANKPLVQCEGIDDTFDIAILVGFHTMAGTPGGLLAHTFVGSTICSLTMNDREVGEAEADAAVLGSFGVPVGMVVGNSDLEPEIRAWNDRCEFVSTKRTLGPTAAVCKTPAATRVLIADAAARMVREHAKAPYQTYLEGEAVTFIVETYRREMATKALTSDTVTAVDDRRFRAEGTDGADAFRKMWSALALALNDPQSWLQ